MSSAPISPRFTNRLSFETSPYLQQHQHNPVDWHPWGEEAFERARRENKPIFLSVGYSTCYWCHVMERECFENESIAALMNRHFVNIKVDREERPDVDQLYMTAVQIMTGQGGWPMSVWLTPDLRPFYGGTYFPPRDMHGRPGFPRVLEALAEAWNERKEDIERSATDLTRAVRSVAAPKPEGEPVLALSDIDRLVRRSAADYEPRFGGFGNAPKFPRQTLLQLLLTWLDGNTDGEQVRKMLRHTLDAMANGGIRDHLGGGFHRYSTDAKWLVPHFEIMLYDQAMLAPVYARASVLFDEPRYATVARGICDFVLRDMTGPAGEFYTAFDAEVDHQEGLNYLWTPEEIRSVLGDDAGRFNAMYGLADGPNFADPHHGNGVPDKNILFLPRGAADESDPAIIRMRHQLRVAREGRKQPLLDCKVITSWNALMAGALAVVGRVLNEPLYVSAAQRNLDFLLRFHVRQDGSHWRTSRDGQTRYDGFLDDYAFFALALLELHTTTRDPRWRREADVIATRMMNRFADEAGGLFFTAAGASELIARQKTAADSPLPSGNALAAIALHALGKPDVAARIISHFGKQLTDYAESMSSLLEAALQIARTRADDVPKTDPLLIPRIDIESHSLVSLTASRVGEKRIEVHAIIDPRYHLYDTNIDPTMGLHATRLRVEGRHADLVDFIDYPPGQMLQLPYGPPVSAYSGNVQMSVTFACPLPPEPITLSLTFQACDETSCLRPAVVSVTV